MTWNGLSVLAVVPARGGSKGVPRKNLCQVGELSLIGHAARTAAQLPWLDARVISTDDRAMAEEGRRHGLDAPFLRPAELATDAADAAGMWRHAWLACETHYRRQFDLSVLLQPTTPLRRAEEVTRTLCALVQGGHRSATTVSPVPGHFAPEKLLVPDDDSGHLRAYLAGGGQSRRQGLPTRYYRNGLCYAVTRECLVERGEIVGDNCVGVIIDRFVVNIDEPYELELARCLYRNGGV